MPALTAQPHLTAWPRMQVTNPSVSRSATRGGSSGQGILSSALGGLGGLAGLAGLAGIGGIGGMGAVPGVAPLPLPL